MLNVDLSTDVKKKGRKKEIKNQDIGFLFTEKGFSIQLLEALVSVFLSMSSTNESSKLQLNREKATT